MTTPVSRSDWNPYLYQRFRRERSQPFLDLLHRLPDIPVRYAADLGCGTGDLTCTLLDRWPEAHIWGVDNSPGMLDRASANLPPAVAHRLTFQPADLAGWQTPQPLDCILANASLQWVPDHARLLERLTGQLAPGGVLAVQMPNNRQERVYQLAASLLEEPAWRNRVPPNALELTVETAAWYTHTLASLGLQADVWETIYQHLLPSPAAIVDWLAGTSLRPVLTALDETAGEAYLAALAALVAEHYPSGPAGVLFPFRRLFFVARRPVVGEGHRHSGMLAGS